MRLLERTAETVEQFIAITTGLRNQWMGDSDMAILPWFRGQADSEWRLLPKFCRVSPVDLLTEREIREEFITHAPALCSVTPRNEWEWPARDASVMLMIVTSGRIAQPR